MSDYLKVSDGLQVMYDAMQAAGDKGRLAFEHIIGISDGMQIASEGMTEEEFQVFSEGVTEAIDEIIVEGFSYTRLAELVNRAANLAHNGREAA